MAAAVQKVLVHRAAGHGGTQGVDAPQQLSLEQAGLGHQQGADDQAGQQDQ
ncbi:hypothetical protein D3C71_2227990 [compost metagenome]